ncbi:MAG: Crp/Fnr family transcriptional regulator [Flavobacteriaceae bacterium]|nr:Crp/Fnr family transcriptional regulator [Flavobacteriaceae bacterium]
MRSLFSNRECRQCVDCDQQSPLFKLLSDDELKLLGEVRYKVHFKPGEIIFKQGTSCFNILSIRSGFVKIYLEDETNRNFTIKISGTDELIGKTNIFLDYRHHYSVAALTDVEVCFMDAIAFKKVIFGNQKFGEFYAKSWGENNVLMWSRMLSVAHKQMNGKIADILLYLSNDVFKNKKLESFITSKLIVEMTGVAKDNVVRTLTKLHNEKVIRFLKDEITILDLDKLEEISITG